MAITRWNPLNGLSTIRRDLDDVFGRLLDEAAVSPWSDIWPTIDVYTEDGTQLVAELQLTDLSPEDVEIVVRDKVLEIRGQKSEEIEERDRGRSYLVRQSATQFFRRIALPNNADTENIDATFDNGMLRIVVPLTEEPDSKKIEVNAGKKPERKNATT